MLEAGVTACKLRQANEHGSTALMEACYGGCASAALKLLEAGGLEGCNVEHVNEYGTSAWNIIATQKSLTAVACKLRALMEVRPWWYPT